MSQEVKIIEPNEVRKGAIVRLEDGRVGEVMDNRKGIRRMIKVEVIGQPGTYDVGDEYVYKWSKVLQDENLYHVKLPEKLQKQADQIRMFMG